LPAILGAYGLGHILIRLLISNGAELDEAEQLLLSQAFAIGYTDQPPLYTWLLRIVQAFLGVNILSLAVLKNLLLFGTYLGLFGAARLVLKNIQLALLTSVSLWLIPQIAWESYRDLTHSVLVTSISAGFLAVTLALVRTGRTWHYLVLGLLLGLGALSKHSFLFFAVALLGATLLHRDMRRRLRDRRMLLAIGLAGLAVLPHFLWLSGHLHLESSPAIGKLARQGSLPSAAAIAAGLLKLLWASISFLTPFWLVCLVVFPMAVWRRGTDATESRRYRELLEHYFLLLGGLLGAAVVFFGVTHFKDRWMQPFLFLTPLYVFVRVQGGGVTPDRLRVYARLLAACGLLFLGAPLAQAWVGPWFGMYSRLHVPFDALASQLQALGFRQGMIVAENTFLGGNLRLTFPQTRVITPEVTIGLRVDPREGGQCLVVWDGAGGQGVPEPLQRVLARTLGADIPAGRAPGYVEAPLKRSSERRFRLGVMLFPAGFGDCR
jgi:4-amino-4-deoxy-L-arabinose transferase-like glycosyltransferase